MEGYVREDDAYFSFVYIYKINLLHTFLGMEFKGRKKKDIFLILKLESYIIFMKTRKIRTVNLY